MPEDLKDRFGVPPFSILDARQGYWQDLKRRWLALGIKSEEGRGEGLMMNNQSRLLDIQSQDKRSRKLAIAGHSPWPSFQYDGERGDSAMESGTSVFDPVLCELMYLWFCPKEGHIVDPFAGGSVRGVVASMLGYEYTGIELRKEQVDANRKQRDDICLPGKPKPEWVHGDSNYIDGLLEGGKFDFIFSCPPYYNLEIYSDEEGELSAMETYEDFIKSYHNIISKACNLLKDNRFACFVVGEIRDEDGRYRNFVGDTINGFLKAGLNYYNEAILVTAVGTLPIRIDRQFNGYRKLGKTHQNILVFYKGDMSKIKMLFGAVGSSGEIARYKKLMEGADEFLDEEQKIDVEEDEDLW